MAMTHEAPKVEKEAGTRPGEERAAHRAQFRIDEPELRASIEGILNRHPAVGLAVGIVRNGSLDFFHGQGFADIASSTPITEDTVFRIGSVTKPFTAIAVMQLHERGLIDLDAPANGYLPAYRLIRRGRASAPRRCGISSPTPPGSPRRATSPTCSTLRRDPSRDGRFT